MGFMSGQLVRLPCLLLFLPLSKFQFKSGRHNRLGNLFSLVLHYLISKCYFSLLSNTSLMSCNSCKCYN